ncbi:MAG: tetratricopeptide repeat protein [Anaerolineae bacterium]|nr:tetratricopeptide repeat protein [Anaerolineae bacterium]
MDHTRAYFQKAQGLLQRGRAAEAYTLIKPILDEQPNNIEGWWLAAHAAPTLSLSIAACEKVLALKPNYAPARKLITELQLKLADQQTKQGQTTEALNLLRRMVKQQPKNVEAWWLLARAAPIAADAIRACEQVLALQPDHQPARQLLSLKTQALHTAQIQKAARPRSRKHQTWAIMGTLGVVVMLLTGTILAVRLTGLTFGIAALARSMSVQKDVGYLGSRIQHHADIPGSYGYSSGSAGSEPAPITDVNTLPVGGTNEYRFTANANALFLAIVSFPATGGTPGNAIELLDPEGYPVPLDKGANASGKGTAFIQATLPKTGQYVLKMKGIAGTAQGTYAIQFGVQDVDDP